MIELIISNNDAGQRLNKFLMKYLNEAPSSFIYKMLRKKNIVLNNLKAKGDEILVLGDSVKLYLADETITRFQSDNNNKQCDKAVTNKEINKNTLVILYKNNDIIAVHKPAGVLSQKSKSSDYSINECIVDYYNTNISDSLYNQTFKPSVCNRLDRNTSGIILAGISLKGSQMLSRMLKDREADKFYFTIVKGDFKSRKRITSYISKDGTQNMSVVIGEADYNKSKKYPEEYTRIETEFIPVSFSNGFTLLKIKLITGKSHQIRAQLKQLGFPIIGDTKYGDESCNRQMKKNFNLKNQLLHAGLVIMPDQTRIYDPLPEQFIMICNGLGLDIKNIEE